MYIQGNKTNKKNKGMAVPNTVVQKNRNKRQSFEFVDNRPSAFTQRELQKIANQGCQVEKVANLQAIMQKDSMPTPVVQRVINIGDETKDDMAALLREFLEKTIIPYYGPESIYEDDQYLIALQLETWDKENKEFDDWDDLIDEMKYGAR